MGTGVGMEAIVFENFPRIHVIFAEISRPTLIQCPHDGPRGGAAAGHFSVTRRVYGRNPDSVPHWRTRDLSLSAPGDPDRSRPGSGRTGNRAGGRPPRASQTGAGAQGPEGG